MTTELLIQLLSVVTTFLALLVFPAIFAITRLYSRIGNSERDCAELRSQVTELKAKAADARELTALATRLAATEQDLRHGDQRFEAIMIELTKLGTKLDIYGARPAVGGRREGDA